VENGKSDNHDGQKLIYHELVSGPLSAIPLKANSVDPTINATSNTRKIKSPTLDISKYKKKILMAKWI
jgi:hypothetical protein